MARTVAASKARNQFVWQDYLCTIQVDGRSIFYRYREAGPKDALTLCCYTGFHPSPRGIFELKEEVPAFLPLPRISVADQPGLTLMWR